MEGNGPKLGIDLERAVLQRFLFGIGAGATCQCIDARHQFRLASGFGQVVVGTGIQRTYDVSLAVALGEKHHWNLPVQLRTYAFQNLNPCHVGYLPIHHQQIIAAVKDRAQECLA